jgi:NadR type nicotinamide-nucleotide adenylyltransferase
MEIVVPRAGAGMILGKFLPPHAGHQLLIQFGLSFVERLYVLVCTLDREPIPGVLRFAWMRELFPQASVIHIDRELPQEPHEHPRFWDIWRETVRSAVGEPIGYVFASEDYGYRLASELGARFVPVDLGRMLVPVSGTAIRSRPLEHWEHLPECVRPYFVKRVCLFGPESTGKSTLARDLAAHFRTVHVPEFARGWLDPQGGICTTEDIPIIARGQAAAEDALARRANRVLVCDTDLGLTTVWSDVLFDHCPPWIERAAAERRYDLTLLLDIDVPWVDDAQRFLPHHRREFFNRCRSFLELHHRPYILVKGDWQQRFEIARRAIEQLLQ